MMSDQERRLAIELAGAPPHDLAQTLQRHLDAAEWRLLEAVIEVNQIEGKGLYLVGGLVRDLLLGRSGKDFDLVLEGDAIKLAHELAGRYGGQVSSHKRFGTATWMLVDATAQITSALGLGQVALPQSLDFISARSESYTEAGALPKVRFADIAADTGRRDFSINTLALRLDGAHFGELIDLWGGLEDLKEGRLRVLHAHSFEDDPTRILRILRFQGRFGFSIEPQSDQQLESSLELLKEISGERLRNELDKVFAEDAWAQILDEMEKRSVLKAIHPALDFDEESQAAMEAAKELDGTHEWDVDTFTQAWLDMTIWMLQLDAQIRQKVSERLNLEKPIRDALVQLDDWRKLLTSLESMTVSQANAALEGLSALARFALYARGAGKQGAEIVARFVREGQQVRPRTTGAQLKQRGLAEGPRYAQILARLQAAWWDGEISSADEEEELLAQLLKDGQASDGY